MKKKKSLKIREFSKKKKQKLQPKKFMPDYFSKI
jgi:hypothetical protein